MQSVLYGNDSVRRLDMDALSSLVLVLSLALLMFFVMLGWFVIIAPRRKTAAILARPPHEDLREPVRAGVPSEWLTYRVLPQPGWRTAWRIYTSAGTLVGAMEINAFRRGDTRGADLVKLGEDEFWFRKNRQGLRQNGFNVIHRGVHIELRADETFGLANTVATGFRALRYKQDESSRGIRSETKRLVSTRGDKMLAMGSRRIALEPGFAAMSATATALDRAIFFYCMLLV